MSDWLTSLLPRDAPEPQKEKYKARVQNTKIVRDALKRVDCLLTFDDLVRETKLTDAQVRDVLRRSLGKTIYSTPVCYGIKSQNSDVARESKKV